MVLPEAPVIPEGAILVENTSMPEPRAKGLSLWLMPEGPVHETLVGRIEHLAERLATARFEPHVTLLPGVSGPEADVVDGARALAAELAPLALEPSEVGGADAHFRCLFFRIRATEALRAAHTRAARRFGREPDPSFDPHLSLVYGTLDTRVKAELSRELAEGIPASFEVRRLHVWRTEGVVREWRKLDSIAFAGHV
jgi:2'-5' RNA ligase